MQLRLLPRADWSLSTASRKRRRPCSKARVFGIGRSVWTGCR